MWHKYPILLPLGILLAIILICIAFFAAWTDGFYTARPTPVPIQKEEPLPNLSPARGHYRGLLHI